MHERGLLYLLSIGRGLNQHDGMNAASDEIMHEAVNCKLQMD